MGVFDDLVAFVAGVPDLIVDKISSGVVALGDLIGFDGKAVIQYFAPILNYFKGLPGKVLDFAAGIPDRLAAVWSSVTTGFTTKLQEIVDWFTGMPARLTTAFTTLTSWISEKRTALVDTFQGWVDGIKGVFEGIVGWIKDALGLGPDGALTKLMAKAETLRAAAADPVGTVGSVATGISDRADSMSGGLLGRFADSAVSGYDSVSSGLGSAKNAVLDLLPDWGFARGGIVTSPVSALIGESSVEEAVIPLSPQAIAAFVRPVLAQAASMSMGSGMYSNFMPEPAQAPQITTVGSDGTASSEDLSMDALRMVINNVGSMPGQLMDMLAGDKTPVAPTPMATPSSPGKLTVQVRGRLHADIPSLSRHLYAVIEDEAGGAGMGVMGGG